MSVVGRGWAAQLACLVALATVGACGSDGGPDPIDAAGHDASGPDSGDAGDTADAGDAGPVDAAAPTCTQDGAVDPDGVIFGLPTVDVPVSSPVTTPQTQVTVPASHFFKQVGVLSLSPEVTDLRAVEHVLRPMGIPYAITTSPKLSVQHEMAIFFP